MALAEGKDPGARADLTAELLATLGRPRPQLDSHEVPA